jgi:hypothetical protein
MPHLEDHNTWTSRKRKHGNTSYHNTHTRQKCTHANCLGCLEEYIEDLEGELEYVKGHNTIAGAEIVDLWRQLNSQAPGKKRQKI